MGLRRSALSLLALVGLSLAGRPAYAEPCRATFKDHPIRQTIIGGKTSTVVLLDLLSAKGCGGELLWGVSPINPNPVPSWVALDAAAGTLTFTPAPTDAGNNHQFRLTVREKKPTSPEPEPGDINNYFITVLTEPVWSTNPIDLGDIMESTPMPTFDLKLHVSDPAGHPVEITLDDPNNRFPSNWLTMHPDDTLTGTPSRADVGVFDGFFFVAKTQSGGTARVPARGRVVKVCKPPSWTGNPLSLPDALEDKDYSQDVSTAQYVNRPEPEPVTFEILSGTNRDWLQMDADGKITGKPLRQHEGPVSLQTRLSQTCEGQLFQSETTLRFDVKLVNKPPSWTKNPIDLPNAFKNTLYGPHDLKAFVTDPDRNPTFTFTTISWTGPGTAWADIGRSGQLIGTPKAGNVGQHEWVVEVTDGEFPVRARVRVLVVNRPPVCQSPVTLANALEDRQFSDDLNRFVTDADRETLTFTPIKQPPWMTTGTDGKLSGLPKQAHIGPYEAEFEVKDPDGGSCRLFATGKVEESNAAPEWTKTVYDLPDAFVDESYFQNVSSFVSDPDGDIITCERQTPSQWIHVTDQCRIIGTPEASDLGPHTIVIRASDPSGLFDDAEFRIRVRNRNVDPHWTKPIIDLGIAHVGKDFRFDLRPFVVDPEGDPLEFKKGMATPGWLQVSREGIVTGRPGDTDLGTYPTKFEVSDDGVNWVSVDAFGKVVKAHPPELKEPMLRFTVRAGETLTVNLDQPLYVTDPDGDDIVLFELLRTETWLELSPAGVLVLRPQEPQIGQHSFPLRVTDATGLTDEAPILITVIKGKQGVKWLEDPIRYTTIVNKDFAADLKTKISNPDGLAVSFTKHSGDPWLTIQSSGLMSGRPTVVREDFFSISVTPQGAPAIFATLIIKVVPDGGDDSIRIDEPVPGARVDNLWIVDNAYNPCGPGSCIITELKSAIDTYYRELDKARIHHLGIYLSSDACTYRSPIRDSRGELLLRWDDRDWTKSFINRIDRSPGKPEFNSSLVAIWQFLFKGLSVPAPYYEALVPMDMLMVSQAADQYRGFYHWPEVSGWTPSRFTQFYQDELSRARKPLRISAIAPQSAAYQNPVGATKGDYYTYSGHFDMEDAILDYAEDVIFRAYVTAKKRIKLSRTPSDPASIKVTLAGRDLAANQWRYDAATNEVEIFWHLIDMSTLKPGDRLVITYR